MLDPDKIIHDHGKWLMPLLIILAAIVAFLLDKFSTTRFPEGPAPQESDAALQQ